MSQPAHDQHERCVNCVKPLLPGDALGEWKGFTLHLGCASFMRINDLEATVKRLTQAVKEMTYVVG